MKTSRSASSHLMLLCGLLISFACPWRLRAQASAPAEAAFQQYARGVEERILQQHRETARFVAPEDAARLRRGELILECLSPTMQPADALLHHWRGTIFVAGATAPQVQDLLRNFKEYPQYFAPEVIAASAHPQGDRWLATVRVRQRHVITVEMEGTYEVQFGRLDVDDGWSSSRSVSMHEIVSGRSGSRPLKTADDHGFLWNLNTYWTWQQVSGGAVLQVESVSLSRAIPAGLGWLLRPYVVSVPRESLEFTLRSAANALRGGSRQ